MARPPFSQLETEKFRVKMRRRAIAIYRTLFSGAVVDDKSRDNGDQPHVLDQAYGIDCELVFPSGQRITLQEKFRKNKFLYHRSLQVEPPTPDFTQEYMNAVGTEHESEGEWFHLAAQFYFYGWATPQEDGFAKWVLLDILKYKLLVESSGGLDQVGELCQNMRHGRASFYAIPITRLKEAWVATYKDPHKVLSP